MLAALVGAGCADELTGPAVLEPDDVAYATEPTTPVAKSESSVEEIPLTEIDDTPAPIPRIGEIAGLTEAERVIVADAVRRAAGTATVRRVQVRLGDAYVAVEVPEEDVEPVRAAVIPLFQNEALVRVTAALPPQPSILGLTPQALRPDLAPSGVIEPARLWASLKSAYATACDDEIDPKTIVKNRSFEGYPKRVEPSALFRGNIVKQQHAVSIADSGAGAVVLKVETRVWWRPASATQWSFAKLPSDNLDEGSVPDDACKAGIIKAISR